MKVLTIGTFDVFHRGHLRLLQRCSQYGLTEVGVNSDEFITKYKGKAPIMSYTERASIIQDLGYHVWKNEQPDGTVRDVIKKSKPDLLVIGSDWLAKDYLLQIGLDSVYLEDNNISLLYIPYTREISTTEIKRRICELV